MSNAVTLRTVAHQTPLAMASFTQEYWNGSPCPPPGDLPDPGTKPALLLSPALARGSLPLAPTGKPQVNFPGQANELLPHEVDDCCPGSWEPVSPLRAILQITIARGSRECKPCWFSKLEVWGLSLGHRS